MDKASFNVPSISCSICSGKIKNELKGMSGIEDVNVDLKSQTVDVTFDPNKLGPHDIKSKIAGMGYEVNQ